MTNRQKAKLVVLIRAKHYQYTLKNILKRCHLSKTTFYYEWRQIQKPPKHWYLKRLIYWIYRVIGHKNYGYRKIWNELIKRGYHYCKETIRKLTKLIGIQVAKFNQHLSPKYHSYKGHVGNKALLTGFIKISVRKGLIMSYILMLPK